jgi:putative tail fiber protein
MANLKEQEKWEDGVYQIEENDPVLGGENGITNKPAKQLANRTLWLKKALELFGKKSAPKDLTAESISTADETGHTHKLPLASVTAKGVVKLNSQTASDSEQDAATPKAVKIAYNAAVEAKTAADTAQRTASDANNNANTRQLKSELVGEIAFFASSTPPSGWLKANGAAVSRTTYAALFAAIGTTFGAGDGRTTFNLPDLRGEFLRGLDEGRNIDRGRRLGTAQGDAIRNITGKLDGSAMGSGNQVLEGKMIASGAIGTTYQQRQWSGDQGGWGEQSVSFDFDASRVVPTASENRPRNVALLACIKY